MFAVGANVFKVVEKPENVPRPWRRHTFGLDLSQNVHLERVLLMPIGIGREHL
jgi:hypothetical protein